MTLETHLISIKKIIGGMNSPKKNPKNKKERKPTNQTNKQNTHTQNNVEFIAHLL